VLQTGAFASTIHLDVDAIFQAVAAAEPDMLLQQHQLHQDVCVILLLAEHQAARVALELPFSPLAAPAAPTTSAEPVDLIVFVQDH
jgi:hypothetical protein